MGESHTKTKGEKHMKKVLALLLAMMLLSSTALAFDTTGVKYYADYSSMAQAQAEAAKLGEELGE